MARTVQNLIRLAHLPLLAAALSCSSAPSVGDLIVLDARKGSARKTLAQDKVEQTYLLLPFSAPANSTSGAGSFSVQLDMNRPTDSVSRIQATSIYRLPEGIEYLRKRMNGERLRAQTSIAHLRKAEEAYRINPMKFSTAYFPSGQPTIRRADLSTTLPLFSPFDGELNQAITGVLKGKSENAAIYVDYRDADLVSQDQAVALLDAYDRITLPRLHALAGHEADIDNNGVVILYLAAKDRIGSGQLGFFRPVDLLPDGTASGTRSNEAEIVYVRIPETNVPLSLTHATVAHETFHLINFSVKSLPIFQHTGNFFITGEDLFLNEGLAHLAEELTGWGVCTPILTQIYLDCMDHTSLAGSGDTDVPDRPYCAIAATGQDSLPRRGAAMLYLLYLYQQLGGATFSPLNPGSVEGPGVTFFRKLNSSPLSGITNIESASGRKFFPTYADFTAALALDNLGIAEDPRYGFHEEEIDPFTEEFRNIRMHSTRIDIDGSTIVLNGPRAESIVATDLETHISGSLFRTGAKAMRLTVPAGLSTTLTIDGDSDLGLGLTVVRAP